MKKAWCIALCLYVILACAGCAAKGEPAENKINHVDLSQEQNDLISILSARSHADFVHMFEYTLLEDTTQILFWLEAYEKGNQIVFSEEGFLQASISPSGETSGNLFLVAYNSFTAPSFDLQASFYNASGGQTAPGSSITGLEMQFGEAMQYSFQSEDTALVPGQDIVIAAVFYNAGEGATSGGDLSTLSSEALAENDYTVLLKCRIN
ncbi:hypothetical protein LJC56_00270 [Christensenellaceae bacterium OttesenSCG-928-K19]|nr:hypothetical protein [Christensenellaceae bacterium OttesenSCG-928-K19]